jgi:hypothetical protein
MRCQNFQNVIHAAFMRSTWLDRERALVVQLIRVHEGRWEPFLGKVVEIRDEGTRFSVAKAEL